MCFTRLFSVLSSSVRDSLTLCGLVVSSGVMSASLRVLLIAPWWEVQPWCRQLFCWWPSLLPLGHRFFGGKDISWFGTSLQLHTWTSIFCPLLVCLLTNNEGSAPRYLWLLQEVVLYMCWCWKAQHRYLREHPVTYIAQDVVLQFLFSIFHDKGFKPAAIVVYSAALKDPPC